MLSQLKEDVLNHGLEDFGKKVPYLRKLCLINSVAADQTLNVIMNRFPSKVFFKSYCFELFYIFRYLRRFGKFGLH